MSELDDLQYKAIMKAFSIRHTAHSVHTCSESPNDLLVAMELDDRVKLIRSHRGLERCLYYFDVTGVETSILIEVIYSATYDWANVYVRSDSSYDAMASALASVLGFSSFERLPSDDVLASFNHFTPPPDTYLSDDDDIW